MALIKCPECGKDVSTNAVACPHCGNPMNRPEKKYEYTETQVVKIRTLGRSTAALNKKLEPYIFQGWEVVTMIEDHLLGGIASPVYKVTLKRSSSSPYSNMNSSSSNIKNKNLQPLPKFCPSCGEAITSNTNYCNYCEAKIK